MKKSIFKEGKKASFKLTKQILKKLENEGIPKDIIFKMQSLINQNFKNEEALITALEKEIGEQEILNCKSKIIKDAGKGFYSFNDYFDLDNPTEEITGEFGYSFSFEVKKLSQSDYHNEEATKSLEESDYQITPKISLTSEKAKRAFMIPPVLFERIKVTESRVNFDYTIEVDNEHPLNLTFNIRLTIGERKQMVTANDQQGLSHLLRKFNNLDNNSE